MVILSFEKQRNHPNYLVKSFASVSSQIVLIIHFSKAFMVSLKTDRHLHHEITDK